jgi:hypothetical protein
VRALDHGLPGDVFDMDNSVAVLDGRVARDAEEPQVGVMERRLAAGPGVLDGDVLIICGDRERAPS